MLMIPAMHMASSGGAAANAVNFDGTNDYMRYNSNLTGITDVKTMTLSFWIKGAASVGKIIYSHDPSNGRVLIQTVATGKISIEVLNPAFGYVVRFTINTVVMDSAWHHVLVSLDSASTSTRYVFIDDVDRTSATTWTNYDTSTLMDFTSNPVIIGADASAGSKLTADLAEFYFNNAYIDISSSTNRRKFITATLAPEPRDANGGYGGADIPKVWFSGTTATWHTNKGTGGGTTLTGTLTDGTLPVQA